MQTTALNPAIGKMMSTAAKPPAPAGANFGATLATAIADAMPEHASSISANKTAARSNQRLDSGGDLKPLRQLDVDAAEKSVVKADPKSNTASASQPANKLNSKTGEDPKAKPDDSGGDPQAAPSAHSSEQLMPANVVVATSPPPAPFPLPASTDAAASAVPIVNDPVVEPVTVEPVTTELRTPEAVAPKLKTGPLLNRAGTFGSSVAEVAPSAQQQEVEAPGSLVAAERVSGTTANADQTAFESLTRDNSVPESPAPEQLSSSYESTAGAASSQQGTSSGEAQADSSQGPSLDASPASLNATVADEAHTPNIAFTDARCVPSTEAVCTAPGSSPHPAAGAPVLAFSLTAVGASNHTAPAAPSTADAGVPRELVPIDDNQKNGAVPDSEKPIRPVSSAPATASASPNSTPIAAPSSGIERWFHQNAAASGPILPGDSCVLPQTTDQSDPASSNIPPIATPVDARVPVEQDETETKQSSQPPAGVQKKLAAPTASDATPSHDISRTAVADRSVAPVLVSPNSVETPTTSQTKGGQSSELPKTQQMLDSAPSAPLTFPNERSTPTPTADLQMHVGIRTTAFGAVEIHTMVVQNQVGIAVHGEHGLAHWFSSEIPGLESGLKDHSMNLAALHFDNGRSGVQTATTFHHQPPHRNFSQAAAVPAVSEDSDDAAPANPSNSLPLEVCATPAGTHVSIHV